jgi:STAG domain
VPGWPWIALFRVGACGTPSYSSVVRPFRYVFTLAASQLVTSLVRVIVTLTGARDTAQRQLDAEQKKKASKVSTPTALHLRKRGIAAAFVALHVDLTCPIVTGHVEVHFPARDWRETPSRCVANWFVGCVVV